MKTFKNLLVQLNEAKSGYIYDTKPTTSKEAEDPEMVVQGYGKLLYTQVKTKLIRYSEDFVKFAKNEQWGSIEYNMKIYHVFLEAVKDVEDEMSSSVWKRKTTKLKRAGK